MKHLLLILSLFTMTATAAPKHHPHIKTLHSKVQTYVYVCTGNYSKRYHSSPNCKGLHNCKGDIVKMTLDEATKEGRTPCHICE